LFFQREIDMKRRQAMMKLFPLALTAAATLLLAGCGGGGSGVASMSLGDTTGAGMTIGSDSPGSLSGSVVKGPVGGATVRAFAVNGGAMGAQIASAVTDANGNFTMPMGNYAGALMLQMSGGSYIDEATGAPMPMGNGDMMTAALTTIGAGAGLSGVTVTPLTAMAQVMAQHMVGGLTDANIAAANAAVGNYYMVHDILHTQPINPLVPGSAAGATQDMMNYGITLAAMSQYAHSAGMANSSGFVTAMMNDASDGVIDGKASGTALTLPGAAGGGMMGGGGMGGGMMPPDAGGAGLTTAIRDFMNSGQNRSGLSVADMTTLMQRLRDGTGHLH
jgi:hypothetical protein